MFENLDTLAGVATGVGAVLVASLAWYAVDRWATHTFKKCADSPQYDPYLPEVRRLRDMPGVAPGVAVSIQDQQTGEFYYYPKGSEVRMKRDQVTGNLSADPVVKATDQ